MKRKKIIVAVSDLVSIGLAFVIGYNITSLYCWLIGMQNALDKIGISIVEFEKVLFYPKIIFIACVLYVIANIVLQVIVIKSDEEKEG